jgi:hypothetical protein
MNIDNDPSVSSREFVFCEEGDRLAQQFIKAARFAVQLAGMADPCQLRDNLDHALTEWFGHSYVCPDCSIYSRVTAALPSRPKYLH